MGLLEHLHKEVEERGGLNLREVCRLCRAFEPYLDVNLRGRMEGEVGKSCFLVGQGIQAVGVLEDNPGVQRLLEEVEVLVEDLEGRLYLFSISLTLHLRLKCSRLCVRGIPDPVGRSCVPNL